MTMRRSLTVALALSLLAMPACHRSTGPAGELATWCSAYSTFLQDALETASSSPAVAGRILDHDAGAMRTAQDQLSAGGSPYAAGADRMVSDAEALQTAVANADYAAAQDRTVALRNDVGLVPCSESFAPF